MKEADKLLPENKYVVPVQIDDHTMIITRADYNPNRVKVVVKDGIITEVLGEG